MTPLGALITALALLAVLVARAGLTRAAAGSAVAARLRSLYGVVAALLALRLLVAAVPATVPDILLMLVAAWLPFAGLRFAEEACRRHAARPVKLLALGGAIGFSVIALVVGWHWSDAAMAALAGFQALMLALIAWHLLRSRRDLGAAERRAVDTLLVAFVLTIPLAVSDFTALWPYLPVRGGAFAILILVLASGRLATGRGTPLKLAGDVALLLAAAGVTLLAARLTDTLAALPLAAVAAALTGLVLIAERAAAQRHRRSGLLPALARSADADRATLLAAHPLLASGRLLEGADLAAYPPASIARLLDYPVVSAETGDEDVRAAARDLLDATGTTHLLRIARAPPRFLAVAAGDLAAPALDDELAVAARLIESMP